MGIESLGFVGDLVGFLSARGKVAFDLVIKESETETTRQAARFPIITKTSSPELSSQQCPREDTTSTQTWNKTWNNVNRLCGTARDFYFATGEVI